MPAAQMSAPSSMIVLMVRMQRPQRGLQPRQPYTCTGELGAACATTSRIWWSERTLQEQMIMRVSCDLAAQDRLGSLLE